MRAVKFVLLTVLLLATLFSGAIVVARQLRLTAFAPPPEVQTISFTVSAASPITLTGVLPADILGVGAIPLIDCANTGLVCDDPYTGEHDEVLGLSFGYDFVAEDLPSVMFSVALGSQGLPNTAVRTEASCNPPEPQADVFESALDGTNRQDLDGNGLACGSNNGFGLGLNEAAPSDAVHEIERDPCVYVDANCNGELEDPILVTLAPGSPTLNAIGASTSDILLIGGRLEPHIWAHGVSDLGLQANDVIDALCVKANGDGAYAAADDIVMFSLAPGSPSLAAWSAGPADLLTPYNKFRYPASMLGLLATDDVDGLLCARTLNLMNVYLPIITKSS